MKYLILILTLVSIFGCSIDPISKSALMRQPPSDALPIQFWPIGQQTFNEYKPGYPIVHKCFAVERQCDDPLKLQYIDDPLSQYFISFFNDDGVQVASVPFIETSQNEEIVNASFITDLDGLSQTSLGDATRTNPWAWESTDGGRLQNAVGQVGTDVQNGLIVKKSVVGIEGNSTVTARWGIGDNSVTTKIVKLQLYLIRAGVIIQTVTVDTKAGATSSSFTNTITDLPFVAATNYDQIGIGILYSDPGGLSSPSVYLYHFSVESLQPSRYDLTVVPQDIGVCEDDYQAFISTGGPANDLAYPTPVGDWVNVPFGGLPNWTIDSGGAHASLISGQNTCNVSIPISGLLPGDVVKVFIELDANLSASAAHITAAFYSPGPTLASNTATIFSTLFSNISTTTFTIIGSVNPIELRIVVTLSSAPSSPINYTLNPNLRIYKVAGTAIYKSDFIKYRSLITENTFIRYKSSKNFAGIVYPNDDTYFNIRIPGVFFHQRFPTEQKGIELSNSREINTGSVLKLQKLLAVQDCPYYLHNKLILILQHAISGSLVINNVEWTVEEAYTVDDNSDPMYELRRASVYLTRRNYVDRNVI